MARRFLILANPISGGGKSKRLAPELANALLLRGHEVELHVTTCKGDAGARAGAVERGQYDTIVAVGGDGTLNEILNGLRDLSQPLALLPLGTANVLAKELAIPFAPTAVAELLDRGRPRELAVGRANGRRFLLFCGIGFDAAMVQHLEQVRTGTAGFRKWTRPVLSVAWRWPLHDLVVQADGVEVSRRVTQVLVTRVRAYGGFLHLPRVVDWRDGNLHLLSFLSRSRLAYATKTLLAFLRRLNPSRSLLHCTSSRITVTSELPTPYQIDGDFGGTTPVQIERLEQRAWVYTPL